MTWHYTISDDFETMTVYDHTGAEVATVANNGTGFRAPGDVLDVMRAEVMADGLSGGLTDRQVAILLDAVFEDIEEGQPSGSG